MKRLKNFTVWNYLEFYLALFISMGIAVYIFV